MLLGLARAMSRRQLVAGAAAVGLVVAIVGCASPQAASVPAGSAGGEVVRILGSWEDSELENLREVVAPFEARTGYDVEFTTTRDLAAGVRSALAEGEVPDIAGLPGPGFMADLAREGHLVDLGTVIDIGAYKRQTAPAFVQLGSIDGRVVGVFLKGTVKGLLWFDPDVYREGPFAAWARLQHAAMSEDDIRPWCIGLESDEASGWPGTDWIEDFVLRQSGPQVYDDWVAGRLPWSSPEIRWAFQSYGTLVGEQDVAGGIKGALETHFSRAGDGLFTDPPECLFVHQGTFMSTFLDEAVAGTDKTYDMMPFPDIDPRFRGALIGAGDLIALLRDTPAARQLIDYLLSTEAQSILVADGGALSGNILTSNYPSQLLQRQAKLLADATIFRFDASDSMPEEMNRAFWKAVLDFTADQSKLDIILAGLDAVREEAYAAG